MNYRLMFPDLTPKTAPMTAKPLRLKIDGLGHPTTRSAVNKRLECIAAGTAAGSRRATIAHPCCRCDWGRASRMVNTVCVCGEAHKGCKVH